MRLSVVAGVTLGCVLNVAVAVVGAPAGAGAVAAPPVISELSQLYGPIGGGNQVVILGSNFTTLTKVHFGTPLASFTFVSDSEIRATAPAHGATSVKVQVVNAYGSSASTAADVYAYTEAPVIDYLPLAAGPIGGGEKVTIIGSGFSGVRSVMFGSAKATSFTVKSSTDIVAIAPAHGATAVRVAVVASAGTSPSEKSDWFTYGPARAAGAIQSAHGVTDPVVTRLDDVSCASSTSCVAVGIIGPTEEDDSDEILGPAVIETRSGATWTGAVAPKPTGGSGWEELTSVSCSASRCAADGTDGLSTSVKNFFETRVSGTWKASVAPVPAGEPSGSSVYQLGPVTCVSDGCVALAAWSGSSSSGLALEVLTGASWAASALPADASYFGSMSCTAVSSCVIVGAQSEFGSPVAESLAGGEWTVTNPPVPPDATTETRPKALDNVTCFTPGSCIAFGSYTNASNQIATYVSTLASGTWTSIAVPPPADLTTTIPVLYTAKGCASINFCVLLGNYNQHVTSASGEDSTFLIETMHDGVWTTAHGPMPGNTDPLDNGIGLDSIACRADETCTAVGGYSTLGAPAGRFYTPQSVIYSLANGTWSIAEGPAPADLSAYARPYLTAVTSSGPGTYTAIGSYGVAATGYNGAMMVANN